MKPILIGPFSAAPTAEKPAAEIRETIKIELRNIEIIFPFFIFFLLSPFRLGSLALLIPYVSFLIYYIPNNVPEGLSHLLEGDLPAPTPFLPVNLTRLLNLWRIGRPDPEYATLSL